MRRKTTLLLSLILLAAAGLLSAGEPATGSQATDREREVRKVRVEVVEDGKEKRRVVFVNADGEEKHLHTPRVWVGEDGYGFHFGPGGAFLGVELTRITPELRAHFGAPEDRGVLVARVVEDSPATRAGIRTGDVLTGVDGKGVESSGSFLAAISGREAGDRVAVELWRDGHPLEVEATLVEREHDRRHAKALLHRACKEAGNCEQMKQMHRHRFYSEELCGDLEDCNVTVRCDDADCVCKVNGEAVVCPESMGD